MKKLWFRFFEQNLNEGMTYDQASDKAFDDTSEHLANLADYAMMQKEDREVYEAWNDGLEVKRD